jgi:hypothetical protein
MSDLDNPLDRRADQLIGGPGSAHHASGVRSDAVPVVGIG